MIKSFLLKNLTTNSEMSFGFLNEDVLLDEDGIDFGTVDSKNETYYFPDQIGFDINHSRLLNRSVKITGYLYGNGLQYAYESEKAYEIRITEEIERKKAMLSAILNPLDYCRLTVGNYYIEGKPTESIEVGTDYDENNEIFCKVGFSLYCANPLWRYAKNKFRMLSGTEPAFHFPLIIPAEGIVMSVKTSYQLLNIVNDGDVKVGGEFILDASGEVINPCIENVFTREKMQLLHTMQKGERIIINTRNEVLSITGIINNVEYDYYDKWDFSSDFIQFVHGTTTIRYTADNETEKSLDISVDLIEQFLEVRNG